jgi:tRNA(Ile)-lysidine synthase
MDIADKVKKTISNNGLIQKGEHIVIGLSGGPDSVCLFHILYRLAEELDIRLHAVHINHGLRPGAADEDQRYAEALCEEYRIPCYSFSFDVNRIAKEQGISSEDAGRQVRYRSFFEVADRIAEETGESVKVAVAQNMNDQAETVLMRIIRGTGPDGLAGIADLRSEKKKGLVIRPLLVVPREEIEAYCINNNLNPRTDLTNLEPVYTRNRIRLELIPYLCENFNPNITAALSRLSRIAKEDRDYFGGKADAIIAEHVVFMEEGQDGMPCRAAVPLAVICGAHPAIRHRLIIKLFESIGLRRISPLPTLNRRTGSCRRAKRPQRRISRAGTR